MPGKGSTNSIPRKLRVLCIGHHNFEKSDVSYLHIPAPKSLYVRDLLKFDAHSICESVAALHRSLCPYTCTYTPDVDSLLLIDISKDRKSVNTFLSKSSAEGTRLNGPLPKAFFQGLKEDRIYLAVRDKSAKRRVGDDAASGLSKRTRLDEHPTSNSSPIDLRQVAVETANPPVYITGSGRLSLSPPSLDFAQLLTPTVGTRHLVPDFSLSLKCLFEYSGDRVLGVYTPTVCAVDSALTSSMAVEYFDIKRAARFPATLGRLGIGPWAADPSNFPPSQHCVMVVDFAVLMTRSFTIASLDANLSNFLLEVVRDFVAKYTAELGFGPVAEFLKDSPPLSGTQALTRTLKHVEAALRTRVILIVKAYDVLPNYAEAQSLTTSGANASVPSVNDTCDVFKKAFYNVVFHYADIGIIEKIILFGESPAFASVLRPLHSTELNKCKDMIGIAGVTVEQIDAYLSTALEGKPLDNEKKKRLVRVIRKLIPGYVYVAGSPAQYPQGFLHKILPTVIKYYDSDDQVIINHCLPLLDSFVNPDRLRVLRAVYARGKHIWKAHIDVLSVEHTVPKHPNALRRFRHEYADFIPDRADDTPGMKTVFVPNHPDSYFAYCLDSGFLTVTFDSPDASKKFNGMAGVEYQYMFPNPLLWRMFLESVVVPVDQTSVAVREPFDGTPEWIFNAMDPYIKVSRKAVCNVHVNENGLQTLRTHIMHTASVNGGGNIDLAAMEVTTQFKQRIDTLAPLPDKELTVIFEDKSVKIFDLVQGTLGTHLDRKNGTVDESKLKPEHWKQAEQLTELFCSLPDDVFTHAQLPKPEDIPESPAVPIRSLDINPPTKLEDFFFMGWVNKKYGRHSVLKLWHWTEVSTQKYVTDVLAGKIDDPRFRCIKRKSRVTAMTCMVLAGVRVLVHRSSLATNLESEYTVLPKVDGAA